MASACLVGVCSRYDSSHKTVPALRERFLAGGIVPFCPELLGGLGVPRPRMEIVGGNGFDVLDGAAKVLDETGTDRTARMMAGAKAALGMAQAVLPEKVFVKSGSPSCGWGMHKGVEVVGVTSALLHRHGFQLEPVD